MIKYYTRACNFYYGKQAYLLIAKKKALPLCGNKLIAFDNTRKELLGSWGPRPTPATAMVNIFKAEHGKLSPDFKQDLQVWYNKDKGKAIAADLLELL